MPGSVLFCMAEIQKMNGKACVKMHKREKETTKIIYKVQNNKRKVRNTNGKRLLIYQEISPYLDQAILLVYIEMMLLSMGVLLRMKKRIITKKIY